MSLADFYWFSGRMPGRNWSVGSRSLLVLGLYLVFQANSFGLEVLSLEVLEATTTASEAAAISSDGSVVVGVDMDQAVRWVNGQRSVIEEFNGQYSWPMDVTGDGSLVVGYFDFVDDELGRQGFSWSDGVLRPLGFFPGSSESHAIAVSSNGGIIVGTTQGLDGEAIYWEGEQIIKIPQPLELVLQSQANDISSDGSVIVGSGVTGTNLQNVFISYAWSFHDGTSTRLWQGMAVGVSGDGNVVVGYDISVDPGYQYINPIRGKNGIVQTLPILPETISGYAYKTNKNGSVIVGSCKRSDAFPYGDEGTIWVQEDGFKVHSLNTLLDLAGIERNGFSITHAQNINDDGTAIVGVGTLPDGQQRGFLIRLDPPMAWGEYPLENGYADTGDWLGWVFPAHDPWVWSPRLNAWLYVPNRTKDTGQGWVYRLK